MSLITIPQLKRQFSPEIDRGLPFEKRASPQDRQAAGKRIILREAAEKTNLEGIRRGDATTFDIFLSHSYADAEEVLYIKRLLQVCGHTVYVDWEEDHQLSRSEVSSTTAGNLRNRMNHCGSLLVAVSANMGTSRWVPWELGYADGRGKRVAILPFLETDSFADSYAGAEYLGLYPYVDYAEDKQGAWGLWANRAAKTYVRFSDWLHGREPSYHQ